MGDLHALNAVELARLVRAGDASPVDVVQASLARIERHDGALGAFVALRADEALTEARELERALGAGRDPGPLASCPLGVKDLEDVAGMATTFGSVPFRDNVAERDSVQVARLRAAGAIVIGKTNTPEFGYMAHTRNRLFATTRNPWNLKRTPGGSSGGSAAAIAARFVPLATASDGGGSIRIPACYVGAFGFKPTFGRVPVGAEEALGMQRWVDTVHYGPLVRCVEDAAVFLDVTSGYDPRDPMSLPKPAISYAAVLEQMPSRLRVGFSRDLGYAIVQSDLMREVETAVDVFRALGHEVEEVDASFPDLGKAWGFMCGAENAAMLADQAADSHGEFGRSFWAGTEAASSLTQKRTGAFQRQRAALNAMLAELFDRYDLLLTPTLPTEAFAAEGPPPREVEGRALRSPMHFVAFSYPFNFSGHPAATVRAGMCDSGLPCGLQLVAERHRDELVLQAARAYERERPWDDWPELAT